MKDVIGRLFMDLSKDYVASVTDSLTHIDLKRHYHAMYLLDQADEELTQTELAEQLQVDKVAVVRMVDYLTEEGYVKRRANEVDRRKQHVVLQPKADEILPEIRAAFDNAEENLLQILDQKDREDFLRIAQQIREFYNENPSPNVKVNWNIKRVKV